MSPGGKVTDRGLSLCHMAHNTTHTLRNSGEMKIVGRATSTGRSHAQDDEDEEDDDAKEKGEQAEEMFSLQN